MISFLYIFYSKIKYNEEKFIKDSILESRKMYFYQKYSKSSRKAATHKNEGGNIVAKIKIIL